MGRTKDLIVEDWERESYKDSLFHLEKQMEMEWEYEEWMREQKVKKATISVGKRRKNSKFGYGTIDKQLRIIKNRKAVQHIIKGMAASDRQSDRYQLPFPSGKL